MESFLILSLICRFLRSDSDVAVSAIAAHYGLSRFPCLNYNIKKKLISNHKYNEQEIKEKVIEELASGKNVALVSDRGMPGISDPGYIAIKYTIDSGYNVVCLPGACAFLPALVMSGINPQPFLFYGFLNSKSSKRKKELEEIKIKNETTIIYEAPHRLSETLKDILEIYGNIEISISREITKIHEEVIRDNIENILEYADTLKGEFVIILPHIEEEKKQEDMLDIKKEIDKLIDDGYSKSEAIKIVAKQNNIPKNIIYNKYHRE